MRRMSIRRLAATLLVIALMTAGGVAAVLAEEQGTTTTTPIEHVVVVIQSNRTFDNYFGTYPGADGIPAGTCMPYDPHDPRNTACVEPFHTGNQSTLNLNHSSATFQRQFNDGQMDGFVHALNLQGQDGTRTMGYYDGRDLPYYWNLADDYVLFDRFFSAAGGGSAENRMFAIAGVPGTTTSRIPDAGFGETPTIFDRLQEQGISWKFYVQNYDPHLNMRTRDDYAEGLEQVQWVPLLNMDRFIDDPELAGRIVDFSEYYEDLENGTLPAVSYVVALGATEHPPSNPIAGQRFMKRAIQALMRSDAWDSTAFIVLYDDWGGWFDHVPPPQIDEYGYGFRVPAFMVSAYARQGYIDSTELDSTSILRFIQDNWGLEPLAERDARANSIAGAFDFDQPPREPVFISIERVPAVELSEPERAAIYAVYGFGLVFAGLLIALPTVMQKRRAGDE